MSSATSTTRRLDISWKCPFVSLGQSTVVTSSTYIGRVVMAFRECAILLLQWSSWCRATPNSAFCGAAWSFFMEDFQAPLGRMSRPPSDAAKKSSLGVPPCQILGPLRRNSPSSLHAEKASVPCGSDYAASLSIFSKFAPPFFGVSEDNWSISSSALC